MVDSSVVVAVHFPLKLFVFYINYYFFSSFCLTQ